MTETHAQIAHDWLTRFARLNADHDLGTMDEIFVATPYWRDALSYTFNIMTAEGREAIAAMLAERLALTAATHFRLRGEPTLREGLLELWFDFVTPLGDHLGIARLDGRRCRTLYTVMEGLTAHPEAIGPNRPLGVEHVARRDRPNWREAREADTDRYGEGRDPYCLILGGGQGGLALAARLKALSVPTLIVEQNAAIGDSWRNRYRSLVLHDPVWYDHMPYLPFPPTWPVFTPKDKMGDWLESYAAALELDAWTSARCRNAHYDDNAERWTVTVEREGGVVTLHPRHLVFATGAYGPARPVEIEGAETFTGTVMHSSRYQGGEAYRGMQAIVMGSASSAHDVAVDLWEHGAHVTMVQRSPTTVVKSETLMERAMGPLYSEEAVARGISTEIADHIVAATPFALMAEGQIPLWRDIRAQDASFYERLAAAGQALDFGEDQSGLMMKAYRTGSGYYIDVGASELIIEGEVAIVQGEVDRLAGDALLLRDGRTLKADVVIACIGFQSMHETVAKVVSREAADTIGPCWGLGSGVRGDPGPWQGEPRNMWKPTAHPALWCHGGNLALSRYYSKLLALQIKARQAGLPVTVYQHPVKPRTSKADTSLSI